MTKSCPFWRNSYICERQTYSNFEILLYWRLYRYSKKSYQSCPLRHEKEYIIRLKQSFGPVASSAIAIYQGSWSRARCTGIRNFIFYFNADSACKVIFSFETKSKRIQLGLFLIHIIDLNFFYSLISVLNTNFNVQRFYWSLGRIIWYFANDLDAVMMFSGKLFIFNRFICWNCIIIIDFFCIYLPHSYTNVNSLTDDYYKDSLFLFEMNKEIELKWL